MSKHYGEHITPLLKELSDSFWEIDAREGREPYEFGDSALNSAAKIFSAVVLDRLWLNQERDDVPLEERLSQAQSMGEDIRQFILTHLGVDMHEEIKKELK